MLSTNGNRNKFTMNNSNSTNDINSIEVLLSKTNRLLTAVCIPAKKITSFEELTRVSSSMFVAIFEALFHVRIDEIDRSPKSKMAYEQNVQLVVNHLSEQIGINLKHITGELIINGDFKTISNLVNILIGIVSIAR